MEHLVENIMFKMFKYFDGDVRRINHAVKVHSFAKTIGTLENLGDENQLILELAAILHDIGIKVAEKKYNSSAGKYQEIEGPNIAKELLLEFNINNRILDRICFLIGHHHTYSKIDKIDYQILIESDFLVNIYEDNLSIESIRTIRSKYFRTRAGIEILGSLYK